MSESEEVKNLIREMSKTLSDKIERLENSLADRITNIVQEQINAVKMEITQSLSSLEARVVALEEKPVDDRMCNFVVSGLAESDDENVVDKVNTLLQQELKLQDVHVTNADRKPTYNGRVCGVIVAKCTNVDDKNKVMEAKSLLRNSTHHSHISIFNDKPKWQRQHEANVRLVVKTLGTNKLFLRGSRVCASNVEQQWQQVNRGGVRGGARGGQLRGRGAQGPGRIGQGRGTAGQNHA